MSAPVLDVRMRIHREGGSVGVALGHGAAGVALLAGDEILHVPATAALAALEASGATLLWPAQWRAGEECYRAMLPGRDTLAALGRDPALRGRLVLESVAEVPPRAFSLALSALATELTARQLAALQGAIDHGYYDIPRRVGMEELARLSGVSRATMQEHLRKAERATLRLLAHDLRAAGEVDERARKRRGRPRALMAGAVAALRSAGPGIA
ncbi:MAG TPA: helix-turn-helix domain-containing protein [Candidatus Thermoplasmatota archaeon]|nr:helix-turn-helix domain-containing protein [Candidatus Thermoplasmatota archaeon]